MGSIEDSTEPEYDALILGAGLSGTYALYRMRELKLKVRVIEAGSSVGGTWYWNRYPGARFDSESYTYGFSWSKELLDEWDWSERFAPQPETERYVNYVCDKFGLKEDMLFNIRIKTAQYKDDSRTWTLTDYDGKTYTSRFFITCIGVLCNPTLPNVPGTGDFKGEACHTARWPKEAVEFKGKRIGLIGMGASAIQAIPEIAKEIGPDGSLTVFQRTPNWTKPLHNAKISKEEMQKLREDFTGLHKRVRETRMNFIHDANSDSIWDASDEEREALWERLYSQPGFGFWVSNYKEMHTQHEANKLVSDFVAKKIRERVHDQETAEALIPKTHGFGTRRVPLETFFYEAFNRPNVRLVDLLKTPLERVTETGVKTSAENFEFDMIIYATGFDAVTGSFDAIDFTGVDGMKLYDKWSEGPRTYLGFTVQHFPNMFMVMGPHQAYGNIPPSIEAAVDWIANCIQYMGEHNLTRIEPTTENVEKWTEHVHKLAEGLLANEVDSWMTGVNKNVAGKQKRIVARYNGAAPEFRRRVKEVENNHYDTFSLN